MCTNLIVLAHNLVHIWYSCSTRSSLVNRCPKTTLNGDSLPWIMLAISMKLISQCSSHSMSECLQFTPYTLHFTEQSINFHFPNQIRYTWEPYKRIDETPLTHPFIYLSILAVRNIVFNMSLFPLFLSTTRLLYHCNEKLFVSVWEYRHSTRQHYMKAAP